MPTLLFLDVTRLQMVRQSWFGRQCMLVWTPCGRGSKACGADFRLCRQLRVQEHCIKLFESINLEWTKCKSLQTAQPRNPVL